MTAEENLISQRLEKLEAIKKLGFNPYPYSYKQEQHAKEILEKYSELKNEEKTKDNVSVAGRIITLRQMGKASFGHIQDESGKIQFYIREDGVGNKLYELFKNLDLGDIIGIEGLPFRTKTGEVSIWVKNLELLTKSLRPLPEKWHGLKDVEIRYRQRYVDLIVNPEVRDIFIKRTKIIKAVREFLDSRGFLEVETPLLQPVYGGANARPFRTFIHDLKQEVYLSISPETYLKRLLTGGYEKVYTICKNFRNESIDRTHNPEFTMMECYQAYVDYEEMMKITEQLYEYIAKKINNSTIIEIEGKKIDLRAPWKRMTMSEAIKKHGKIDVEKMSLKEIQDYIKKNNIKYEGEKNKGLMVAAIFEEVAEEHLIEPTHIIDHPKETTVLCKVHRKEHHLIERFEPYINSWEVGNGYSELNDAKLQKELFEDQERQRKEGNEEASKMDEDFVNALEVGMPPAGGLGIGIDRMVMLITGQPSIRDVIFFPFMKNLDDKKEL